MTCKDCFHFEVCDSGRHIGEYIDDDGVYSDGVEKECPTFKNKAAYEKAMGKRTPKKPLNPCSRYYGKEKGGNCPVCGAQTNSFTYNYCRKCGQALDWSDTE